MTFTIPIPPKAQKRDRIATRGGHAISYKDSGQKLEEDKILALMYKHKPVIPFAGPVSLEIQAILPIPKSWPKSRQESARLGLIRPIVKPDVDNLAKQIKDCMNEVFYHDDRQVVELVISKYYGSVPKWVIHLEELA